MLKCSLILNILLLVMVMAASHKQANDDKLDVKKEIKMKNKHPVGEIYHFNNAESALKLAEILVKTTLNVQKDDKELKILHESLDRGLALTDHDDKDRFNINVFFQSFYKKYGNNSFHELIDIISNEFEAICVIESDHPSKEYHNSIDNICIVIKYWLADITKNYSKDSEIKNSTKNYSKDSEIKNSTKNYSKDSEIKNSNKKNSIGFSLLNIIACGATTQTYPKEMEMPNSKKDFENKCKENTIEMTKRLYYAIYKHALAYAFISKGMPTFQYFSYGNFEDNLTTYTTMPKMSKGEYLIYWLIKIMKQMFGFELHYFDPIGEKENYVDMKQLTPNKAIGTKITEVRKKLAASAYIENRGSHSTDGQLGKSGDGIDAADGRK